MRPTLPDAVAGDITAAMPYRAMTNIINFIQAVDEVVPGFASNETILIALMSSAKIVIRFIVSYLLRAFL